MFSTLSKTNFNFSARSILSSASSFNLDQSEILWFGKELKSGSQSVLFEMKASSILYHA